MFSEIFAQILPGLLFFIIIYVLILYPVMLFLLTWRKTQRKKENFEIKRYTLEFCLKDDINYEGFLQVSAKYDYEHPNNQNNEELLLIVLSRFEKVSIGLSNKILDEQIIQTYYGKYFAIFYESFKYYILQRRDKSNDPFLFLEYEKTMKRWMSKVEFKRRRDL